MKTIGVWFTLALCGTTVQAQLEENARDTSAPPPLVRGGIYDRPYLFRPSSRLAIGGYAEMTMRSEWVEGVHENVSFEARRFNLFIFSSIAPSIKLTSELEFEHGTEEIKIETALLDIQLFDELTVRGGILLSPLGKFNLVHDGPRNEFTDRPLVSTRIIPATLSEAGFGCYGAFTLHDAHRLTYEAYLVNGLNDDVILNGNGTSIPEGRPKAFDEDNNGSPALVGRLAWQAEFGLELGASVHTGVYNRFKKEGLVVDDKRRLTIVALDGEFRWNALLLQGEFAQADVQIPPSLIGLFAEAQQGFYAQAVYTVLRSMLPMFPQSTLAVGIRYERVDLDTRIRGDHVHRLTVGTNLRLVPDTVIKLDYQHNWIIDRIGNESPTALIHFGIATYF